MSAADQYSIIKTKGIQHPQPVRPARYRRGKMPEFAVHEMEDQEEAEQRDRQEVKEEEVTSTRRPQPVAPRVVSRTEESDSEESGSESDDDGPGRAELLARARKLAAERAKHQAAVVTTGGGDEDDEDSDNEGNRAALIARSRHAVEERVKEEEEAAAAAKRDGATSEDDEDVELEEEEEEEESSESESSSDSDEDEGPLLAGPRFKPVFVRKGERHNTAKVGNQMQYLEKYNETAEDAERKKHEKEDAIVAAISGVSEDIADDQMGDDEEEDTAVVPELGEDFTPATHQEWVLRMLERRYAVDKAARERREEEAEILRRRELTDEQRAKEDAEIAKKYPQREHSKNFVFMQKYYHQGAYYQDLRNEGKEELYLRDYQAPVSLWRLASTRLLKGQMLRRGQYGKIGQTKYTHLSAEDTTQFDAPWSVRAAQEGKGPTPGSFEAEARESVRKVQERMRSKMAGFKNKDTFELPHHRKKQRTSK
ncbi:microfibril-associated protein, putative [Perkinsus marinus ATCC 50983]|uniref:Microfibril-associated protein, putative n=1 Tax=Perkinsus marinus (strain ATCC 50983 / TXsc) TaxID=423536 RepID=C5KT04_PERM5|nr:microfibril-associated protein, putative [Perkinsus marinus ATCC 50983]EER12354.1 microfibril-associated protein, putative [Perkinsus marinus ATCC 50983]|eukprot:XP_002780559.1 microfibril-associated protein, putative [Perkinsus marinus ATCC 50983]